MGVWIKDIDVGKCYVTSTGQVRRVTKVEIKVTYESRGKKAIPNELTTLGSKFARDVDREVPCDYDPADVGPHLGIWDYRRQ
jgi:hypothetical protein